MGWGGGGVGRGVALGRSLNDVIVDFCLCSGQEQRKQRTAEGGTFASWEKQSIVWRDAMDVPRRSKPWTGRDAFQATGLSCTPRVLDLLDCVAHQNMLDRKTGKVLDAVDGVLVDVSQSHARRRYTKEDNIAHCLTTSSCLYHFSRDSALVPAEYFHLQGHGDWTQDAGLPSRKLRCLAGEGIALPCLGHILYSLWLLKGFPPA